MAILQWTRLLGFFVLSHELTGDFLMLQHIGFQYPTAAGKHTHLSLLIHTSQYSASWLSTKLINIKKPSRKWKIFQVWMVGGIYVPSWGGSPSARHPPWTSTYKKRTDLTITIKELLTNNSWSSGMLENGIFFPLDSEHAAEHRNYTWVLTVKLFNILHHPLLVPPSFYRVSSTPLRQGP